MRHLAQTMLRRLQILAAGFRGTPAAFKHQRRQFQSYLEGTGIEIGALPYAVLYHHQSASRGPYDPASDRKYEELLRQRWKQVFERGDPYYNPNLSRTRDDFSLDA